MKKAILTVAAALSLMATMCVSDNLVAQIIWSAASLAVFYTCCKLYEKYYLTDEEKEEQV